MTLIVLQFMVLF